MKFSRWFIIPGLTEKRYQAASVLDVNGDMWVLGGTSNSSAADSTEIYNYKPPRRTLDQLEAGEGGTWRKGFPLPEALRDTGLQSQCTVKINSTHIFMAGGYARDYDVSDTVKNNVNGK